MNILSEWKDRFRAALESLSVSDVDSLLDMIRPSQNSQFGDYQANIAMPLGKRLGKSPRDIASEIVSRLEVDDLCHAPEVAGPGFINLKLRDEWLVGRLEEARHDERLDCARTLSPRTFVVDFSSPNVAKPLHVGHIRSTVIGDALCRTLRFRGHRVVSDNHLGDWGTQFGMIIYGYKHLVDAAAYQQAPIQELGRLYKLVRRLMDYHDGSSSIPQREQDIVAYQQRLADLEDQTVEADAKPEKKRRKAIQKAKHDLSEAIRGLDSLQSLLAEVRSDESTGPLLDEHAQISSAVLQETAKLHAGDAINRELWEEFLPQCREAIQDIYRRLDVTFDQELGESFYHDRLAGVVRSLCEMGLATESEGAICVFLDSFETPFIVRKKDGAFLYATSDLATIRYRMATWSPDAILYIVDFRQSEHFDKLFETARRWGCQDVELKHVKFGTVLGEDKRPYKTRSGDTIGLEGLLDEAESRAYDVVAKNDDEKPGGWELDEPTRRHIARVVGIAALKYADLSQNRESDYVFSYDKMLALHGNTATYMQYSFARVHGIFTKASTSPEEVRRSDARFDVSHPAERTLALALLQFGDAVDDVLADCRPNQMTNYLFELAKRFSTFFDQCPVVKAETEQIRNSRLLLCDLTARTLQQGLALLGIDVVTKM